MSIELAADGNDLDIAMSGPMIGYALEFQRGECTAGASRPKRRHRFLASRVVNPRSSR